MTLVTKKNKATLPAFVSEFFDSGRFLPNVFDFGKDFFDGELAIRMPNVNITETAKDYQVELAAPGLKKDDFKIEVENGYLSISAEKQEEKKEEKKNYRRHEFSYNSFCRSFALPENIISDKIDAKYEDGLLRLTLPKKEVTLEKPKKEIKVA